MSENDALKIYSMPIDHLNGEALKQVRSKNFQNRSEATQEIISQKSGFVERWALLIFLSVLLVLTGATWFVHYPDIIQTRGTLSADNGPKEIIPLQTGRLVRLFVKNGQQLKQGEMIGWIESSARTEEIIQLSALLDSSTNLLAAGKSENLSQLFIRPFRNLGKLQASYQTYINSLQEFNDYLVNGFYLRRKQMLLTDLASIKLIKESLDKQKQLIEQDIALSEKSYRMKQQLFNEKVISAEEYREEESKMVNKQIAVPQINTSLLNTQNQERDKLKDLEQLEHDVIQQKTTFEQALQTLKSNVDDWMHEYTLRAPLDGTINFVMRVQQNQFIQQGKLLGYVNPPDSKFYAEIYLPQQNLGKVDTGMQVQLRFDAYPYQETGFVRGKLAYISKTTSDSGYWAAVRLDHGLETNLRHTLQYKAGLKADALVITSDMRLLTRLYYNLVKVTTPGK